MMHLLVMFLFMVVAMWFATFGVVLIAVLAFFPYVSTLGSLAVAVVLATVAAYTAWKKLS